MTFFGESWDETDKLINDKVLSPMDSETELYMHNYLQVDQMFQGQVKRTEGHQNGLIPMFKEHILKKGQGGGEQLAFRLDLSPISR